jgi:hypothetical protein
MFHILLYHVSNILFDCKKSMAKHKDIFVPWACKNNLVETSLHQNQGCDSSGTGLKEYGTYHA